MAPRNKNLSAPDANGLTARIYDTRDWQTQFSPSLSEMEMLAIETYANLPA
jgi:hypothetical protein